jgi:hypothetical protein
MATDIKVIHGREFLKATAQGAYDLEQSKAALLQVASLDPPSASIDVMIDVREAPSYLSLADLWALAVEFATANWGRPQDRRADEHRPLRKRALLRHLRSQHGSQRPGIYVIRRAFANGWRPQRLERSDAQNVSLANRC